MKTRLLIIIGMIILPMIILDSFSQCVRNEDWIPAPCFDMGKVSELEYKYAWAPYYYEKGHDVMEIKQNEMWDAQKNGTLEEWTDSSHQNWNVYNYYRSVGDISSQFSYDVVLLESSPQYFIEKTIVVSLSVAVIILSIICIILWRKRK